MIPLSIRTADAVMLFITIASIMSLTVALAALAAAVGGLF
jgi:hypothetical protein